MPRRLIALAAVLVASACLPLTTAEAAPTGGTGGPLTDRVDVPFTSGGLTSTYHLFAQGIDTSKEVGFLLYLDGSGAYGFKNENDPYLLDADASNASQSGLRDVARDNNMVLLTATAPPPADADGDNCWYNTSTSPDAAAKARWLKALVDQVYAQYPIEKDRVAMGGYSSGAQGIMRWFAPMFGPAVQTDGVNVGISYGGTPHATAGTPTFTAAYKSAVHFHWNTGTGDQYAYGTAAHQSVGGYNWYKANGFQTSATWPAGLGHNRSDFAALMRAQIATHVRAAQPVGGTTTPPPAAAWDHQIAVRATGATLTVDIPVPSPRVTWRMSASPITTQTGFYDYTDAEGLDQTITTTSTLARGTTYYYQIENGSRSAVVASGTFKTLP